MLLNYVNIDIGTNSIYRQSRGNTLPLIQYPFGMQALVLQTDNDKGGWFYNPNIDYAEGIRFSNQPSPWLGDYGNLTILPSNTIEKLTNFERHSTIKKHKFKPDALEIEFIRYNTKIELEPLKYGAVGKITFKASEEKYLIIDCPHKTQIEYRDNVVDLSVYGDNESYGKKFTKYYRFLSEEIIDVHVIERDNQTYYCIEFGNEKSTLQIGTSYISNQQAAINLKYCESATDEWERLLSKFRLDEDSSYKKLFYSNLYRTLLYPHCVHEPVDGKDYYANFETGEIDSGVMYADIGYWDTYRTSMPLLKLIDENLYREIIKSNINFYKSYGWLGRWISPVERGIMPSTLTDSVVAEAIVGDYVNEEDINIAIEALLKNGETVSTNDLHGRRCLKQYIKKGYVSNEDSHESVSMTLDNAYCDYAIAKALEKVGHSKASEYFERAKNYKNLFNSKTMLFERKDDNGKFDPEFVADEWGIDFCESSSLQNNFNVPHDIETLVDLFGGKKAAIERLDYLFDAKPSYKVGRYGFEIHEMTEFASCNLGYFAISNQPSFILPFVYLYLGEEEKFNKVIEKTLTYFTEEDYPGDEDNGSLSAWLVWVLIGKYPFCPVDNKLLKFESLINLKHK